MQGVELKGGRHAPSCSDEDRTKLKSLSISIKLSTACLNTNRFLFLRGNQNGAAPRRRT
jgi:hypothetical protein